MTSPTRYLLEPVLWGREYFHFDLIQSPSGPGKLVTRSATIHRPHASRGAHREGHQGNLQGESSSLWLERTGSAGPARYHHPSTRATLPVAWSLMLACSTHAPRHSSRSRGAPAYPPLYPP